ncbi:MAG: hypothetical protein K0Q73_5684, partial [Paenibacillus sp.]|nr:hypothetical protein [Paenibacillus sp.]
MEVKWIRMDAKEKITGLQLSTLLISVFIATGIITVPALMTKLTQQTAWLAVFPSALPAIWTIFVMTALAKRFPGMNVLEYSTVLLGKWGGKVVAFGLSYTYFFHIGMVTNQNLDFISLFALPKTPEIIITGMLLVLCGFVVYSGIEVMGRCGEIIVP